MSTKTGWTLPAIAVVAVLAVLVYTVQRDSRYEQTYAGDLRNRVVGARLIKDGRSPYFYKWQAGDPLRYYNPVDFDSLRVSVITASPFFHHLLSPLADMPEARLSRVWLLIEYVQFISIALFAFSLAATRPQRLAVLLFALLLLFTNAWIQHIGGGQNYICIPFLALLFFACVRKNRNTGFAFAAGIAAACLVLIRINTVVFFIPFLFLVRHYSRRWLLAFFVPILALSLWILGDGQERRLWQDYSRQTSEWIKIHQSDPTVRPGPYNGPAPEFPRWEGVDMQKSAANEKALPKIYSENGNVFVLFTAIFHHKLPVAVLGITSAGIILLFTLVFYQRNYRTVSQERTRDTGEDIALPALVRIALFGFCLYMISDLFSPVYRHQYYTIQWAFPLLLAASSFQPRRIGLYGVLLAGLLLNCIHLPFLKMGNSIGEYGILAALLVLSTFSGPVSRQKSAPASLS
jgi:hypothetical protein